MKYLFLLLLLTSCATQTCKGLWMTNAKGDVWCEPTEHTYGYK